MKYPILEYQKTTPNEDPSIYSCTGRLMWATHLVLLNLSVSFIWEWRKFLLTLSNYARAWTFYLLRGVSKNTTKAPVITYFDNFFTPFTCGPATGILTGWLTETHNSRSDARVFWVFSDWAQIQGVGARRQLTWDLMFFISECQSIRVPRYLHWRHCTWLNCAGAAFWGRKHWRKYRQPSKWRLWITVF